MIDRSTWGPQGVPGDDGYMSYPRVDPALKTRKLDELAARYAGVKRQWIDSTNESISLRDKGHDAEARRLDIKQAVDNADPKTGLMADVQTTHRAALATRRQQVDDKATALEEAIERARIALDEEVRKVGAGAKLAEQVTTARAAAVEALKDATARLDEYLSLEGSEVWFKGPGEPLRTWNIVSQTGGPQRVAALFADIVNSISPSTDQEES